MASTEPRPRPVEPPYAFPEDEVLPSSHQSSTQSSPLLALPLTLREKIYTFLLVSENTIRWPSNFRNHGLSPALLRTCKLLHHEAGPVLYKRNVFDFVHPSDCTVFHHTKDSVYAKNITEATFRIRDTDFRRLWDPYLLSEDPYRSLVANLPSLQHLLVVLQVSWWDNRVRPIHNLRDWNNHQELKLLCLALERVKQATNADITIMCRVRVSHDHFNLLRQTYASEASWMQNVPCPLYLVGETRMQTQRQVMNSMDVLLELLSPEDIPLYETP